MSDPSALLTYAVTPRDVPYSEKKTPSVVTLMLTVTNETGKPVECSLLWFRVHAGPRGGDLVADASEIVPTAATGTKWKLSREGDRFTAYPSAPGGTATLAAGDSLAFFLAPVGINGVVGAGQIEVGEETDQPRQGPTLTVQKVPPGLAITKFTVTPVPLPRGETATIAWATTGAKSCKLSWPGGHAPDLPPAGQYEDTPDVTRTYTLTASGGGDTTNPQYLTIAIPEVHIIDFKGTKREIALGEKSKLSWKVANAATLWLNPDNIDLSTKLPTGACEVSPSEKKANDYTLWASDGLEDGSSDSRQFTVYVKPVSIESFEALPAARVWPGEGIKLSWKTSSTSGCSLEPGGFPPLGPSGEQPVPVPPRDKQTYTLRAHGVDDKTAALDIGFLPAFQRLEINQDTIKWSAAGDRVIASSRGKPFGAVDQGNAVRTGFDQYAPNASGSFDARATRDGQASRFVIQIQAQALDPKAGAALAQLWPSTLAIMPVLSLVGPGGLNRPGGQISANASGSAVDVRLALSGWGMKSQPGWGDLKLEAILGSPAGQEPWRLTCIGNTRAFPKFGLPLAFTVTVDVFPLGPDPDVPPR